jgi:hypothetical protein
MWKAWILCLLTVLCFGLPAPAGEFEDEPSPLITCSSCQGAGVLIADCFLCRGEGDHLCPNCTQFGARVPSRVESKWTPQAYGVVMAEFLSDLGKGIKLPKIPGLLGKKTSKAPKAAKIGPGEFRCLGKCTGGKQLYITKWIDCKLCNRGKERCQFCKKGKVRCIPCEGKGKSVAACDDCASTGRLPGTKLFDFETCPWCADAEERECGSCDSDGKVIEPCVKCFGRTRLPCTTCKGVGKMPCSQCRGRGFWGQKKEKCPECSGAGGHSCSDCEKGSTMCSKCSPPKQVPCTHCRGKKKTRVQWLLDRRLSGLGAGI